jgi:ACR3 family arsenite efflux pump ArsB
MVVLLIIAAIIVGVILRGWALTVLWDWFVVPTFHVSALTIPYAIGLVVIINMFINVENHESAEQKAKPLSDRIANALGKLVLTPFITLGLAWIVTLFI